MTEPSAVDKVLFGPDVMVSFGTVGSNWPEGRERCGVFFGRVSEGAEAEALGYPGEVLAVTLGVAEMPNVAADPYHHYEFNPQAQARAWQRIERWGYTVLGLWHSHPLGPEGLSPTDVEFGQPWLLYPVLRPGEGGEGVAVTVYKLAPEEPGGFVAVPHVETAVAFGGFGG